MNNILQDHASKVAKYAIFIHFQGLNIKLDLILLIFLLFHDIHFLTQFSLDQVDYHYVNLKNLLNILYHQD